MYFRVFACCRNVVGMRMIETEDDDEEEEEEEESWRNPTSLNNYGFFSDLQSNKPRSIAQQHILIDWHSAAQNANPSFDRWWRRRRRRRSESHQLCDSICVLHKW